MRAPPFYIVLLLATPAAVAAPAPVYKERPSLETAHRALPEALRVDIEETQKLISAIIEDRKRDSKSAHTRKEKDACLSDLENRKRHYYYHPVQHLEYQRKQPPYQGREDQQKIEEALKFYRLRYHEAKRKGILVEPRGKVPLK